MPQEAIELRTEIPYYSVLDDEGNFDEELAPSIDENELGHLLWHVILARTFDERRLELQRQGSIGTFAPVKGQEAANLGPISALRRGDWLVPSFREPAAAVYRGAEMSQILLYDAGYNEGATADRESRSLPSCIPVASQLPHAVGIAYASKVKKSDEVTMTFFGDGATSEGDFHEAMNFAATWEVPVVFVCQNNQFAISVPRDEQTASKTLAQKAIAYGMPGVQVDGNDLFACRLAANEAVERARAGAGPTMIECVTYRLSVHTTADDPSQYRSQDEVREWEKRDPLPRLKRFALDRDVVSEQDVSKMESDAKEAVDAAWKTAKERIEELAEHPEVMFDHLFEHRPDDLNKQRTAFEADRTGSGTEESSSSEESERRPRANDEQTDTDSAEEDQQERSAHG